MIESIKEFLKQQNLNWTGNISKGMDFYPADEQDFKDLEIIEFLISFGADGMMALSVEIDCANFNILGIFNDYWFEKDASEKFKELGKARDLSQEWINFQINKKGLLYAVKLRDYCLKNKKIIT